MMEAIVVFFYVVAGCFLMDLLTYIQLKKIDELEERLYQDKVQLAGDKLMPIVEACNNIEETAEELASRHDDDYMVIMGAEEARQSVTIQKGYKWVNGKRCYDEIKIKISEE